MRVQVTDDERVGHGCYIDPRIAVLREGVDEDQAYVELVCDDFLIVGSSAEFEALFAQVQAALALAAEKARKREIEEEKATYDRLVKKYGTVAGFESFILSHTDYCAEKKP